MEYLKIEKTQNSILKAHFGWKLTELAVPFSRQILNGSQDFVFSLIFIHILKYEAIEAYARTLLTLNISAIGTVTGCFLGTSFCDIINGS